MNAVQVPYRHSYESGDNREFDIYFRIEFDQANMLKNPIENWAFDKSRRSTTREIAMQVLKTRP